MYWLSWIHCLTGPGWYCSNSIYRHRSFFTRKSKPSCEAKSELDREILEVGSELDAEEIALPANKMDGKLIVAEEILKDTSLWNP